MFEDRNVENIHRILEKTAECKPYEFAKVSTVALIWQLLSSILITKVCQSLDDMVVIWYSADIVLEKKKIINKNFVIKTSRYKNFVLLILSSNFKERQF